MTQTPNSVKRLVSVGLGVPQDRSIPPTRSISEASLRFASHLDLRSTICSTILHVDLGQVLIILSAEPRAQVWGEEGPHSPRPVPRCGLTSRCARGRASCPQSQTTSGAHAHQARAAPLPPGRPHLHGALPTPSRPPPGVTGFCFVCATRCVLPSSRCHRFRRKGQCVVC